MNNLKPFTLGAGAFLYSLLSVSIALADDTEIYVPKDLPADQYVRPNILFVLDSSGSMGSTVAGTGGLSRNQVLKNVVNNLIDDIKVKEDVNVGFMRYNRNTLNNGTDGGGYILSPVERLTNANAASMQAIVNAIPASGNTPLLETYYEAYRYIAGLNRVWGFPNNNGNTPGSAAASLSGETYKSPIEHSCQKSHIIYVTDGAPTNDTSSNPDIKALVSGKNTLYPASSCGNGQGQCLPHLAEYMANQDLMPAPTPFDDPTGRKQTVTSHFVGFTVNLPLLKNAATAGSGSYYTSNDVSGLTDALKAIIVDITADNTSFAAPSVAVSAYNNLGYRDDLYYALFRPAEGTNWPGNVKRYKLGSQQVTDLLTGKVSSEPIILDKNENPAIDSSSGFFSATSSSYWSDLDGLDVTKGGVAGQLPNPASRTIFTWTAADRTPAAGAGVSGAASLESFDSSNGGLTETVLGAPAGQRTRYIDWARGYAINPDGSTSANSRQAVADVLHNEPRLIAYKTDENLTRAKDPDLSKEQLYLFFGDNEGYLHAIDPKFGTEKFAFLPKELLANPGAYYRNANGSANKRYGMDGLFTALTEYGSVNQDQSRTLTKAWLYAGMRRGGSTYYALDVTDINSPKLKWVIKGPEQSVDANGVATNASTDFTPGFAKLGRTFAAPQLADIKIGTTKTKVLIFSGGYDLDQDYVGNNLPKNDDVGSALFIVNADTGKLLWSASNSDADLNLSEMTHSMPSTPTVIDVNRDGLADIIYANDLGGQLFRFDINNTGSGALVNGGRIAALGGTDASNNRRFFASPDVAYFQEPGTAPYFTIAMGSGFRESPLNTDTNDRFYVLRDKDVNSKPTSYVTITEADLVDASGVDLTASQTAAVQTEITRLEGEMAVLNQNLSAAQTAFSNYKNSSGYTAKVNAMDAANSAVDDKQRQIDLLATSGGPYISEHALDSNAQSLLQQSLTTARDVLAGIEQARLAAQGTADSTDAAALTAAAGTAASNLTAAQSAYTAAQGIADSDAANAAAKEAAALASEETAATAVIAYNTALTNKNNSDTALAASSADAASKLTAKNTADAALTSANTAAANALSSKNAADTAYTTTSTTASNALVTQTAAAAALTAADSAAVTALNAKNSADSALATANANVTSATTARNLANTALTAANANVVTRQNAVNTAVSQLTTATNAATAAGSAFSMAEADLNAANADVVAKQNDLITAQAIMDAANQALADNNDPNPVVIQALNDAITAATTSRDNANSALTTATSTAASKETARDNALDAAQDANDDQSLKLAAKNAADAALTTANDAALQAQADKSTADAALVAATNTAASALTEKNAADTALTAANADAATKLIAKNAADTALATANADAVSKLAAQTAASNALDVANSNAATALTAKNNADTALDTANADVVAKQALQTAAVSSLATATSTRDSTATTATADRSASNAAATTAATSAANAASKLTAQTAAVSSKDAADLAVSNAVADDTAAAALTIQRNRMAANYETLINLQSSLDSAYGGILAMENAIIAAKADPAFDSDSIPGMELDLANARNAYTAQTDYTRRTALNNGNPTLAVSLLNDVNAALSAGNAAAIATALNTALGAIESSPIGAPKTLVASVTSLLARDEVSKNNALQIEAHNSQGSLDQIALLTTQKKTLEAQAATLKLDVDKLLADNLTQFEAYQDQIDQALVAANDPVDGLPVLRKKINDEYSKLTIGDSYTPNLTLLDNSKGFYLRLVKGEKVVVDSTSFRGAVLFVTFTPRGQAASTCGSDVGRARFYGLSLKDASSVFTQTINGVTKSVRSVDLLRSGYAPTPSVIFTPNGPAIIVGTEVMKLQCAAGFERVCSDEPMTSTYWREN